MPTPAIVRGSDQFFVTTYEGNGKGQKVGKFVPFTDSGTIAKSCIFNRGDSPKLSKTPGSNGNRKTFTISVWYKPADLGTDRTIMAADTGSSGTGYAMFKLNTNNKMFFYSGTAGGGDVISTRTFEDTSKFYHFVIAVDTTQSTASNRVKFYVDGDQITALDSSTYPDQDGDTNFNSTSYPMAVGSFNSLTNICTGGYLAEVNFVDGAALTPSTFGLTDTSTGRWIPKSLTGITYGTNGFRMQFANSAGQTIGDDTSGNGNDYAVSNLAATDINTDSPTQNFTTLDSGISGSMTLTEGNLRYTTASASNWESVYSDKGVSTGKWYFEVTCKVTTAYDAQPGVILESVMTANKNQLMGYTDGSVGYNMDGSQNTLYYGNNGNTYIAQAATDASTAGVVIGVAYDADTGAMWFAKNNTWVNNGTGAGNPSTGANPTFVEPMFAKQKVRFGFSTYNASASYEINFGAKDFNYTPPTDFKKVNQDNIPDEGKGVADFVWVKNRDATDDHQVYDSTRGVQKDLNFDGAAAEGTTSDGLQKFLKGGFAIEDDVSVNTASESYVAWNWVCNGGTTSANTSATPTIASNFQVNDTAGFSIVTYTGTGSAGTVQHGLSKAPEWIIIKERGNTNGFIVSHKGLTNQATYSVNMSNNNAEYSDAGTYYWNSTAPTSSVFSIATDTAVNRSSGTYVAWCWHSVEGFSKFGRYTGNGSTDGTFVFTGFKPKFLIIKGTNNTNFNLFDSERNQINPIKTQLYADTTEVDYNLAARGHDFLSNGFKLYQEAGYGSNNDGQRYIYMAFAEHPFIGDGTNPCTAR